MSTERVERGPDGTAGEQHVVDEDHAQPVDATGRDVGVPDRAGAPQAEIIAVERDVEYADRNLDAFERVDPRSEAHRERKSTGWDAE